jgi:hypothetical protein
MATKSPRLASSIVSHCAAPGIPEPQVPSRLPCPEGGLRGGVRTRTLQRTQLLQEGPLSVQKGLLQPRAGLPSLRAFGCTTPGKVDPATRP